MEIGKVCKGTAIVIFILDIIGALMASINSGNFIVLLYGIAAGFVFCLLLYAIGEIADQAAYTSNVTYEIYRMLEKLVPEEEQTARDTKPSYLSGAQKTEDGGWICKKCNTKNEGSAQFCKDCGTYK